MCGGITLDGKDMREACHKMAVFMTMMSRADAKHKQRCVRMREVWAVNMDWHQCVVGQEGKDSWG